MIAEDPNQEGDMQGVLTDALRVGDAAQEIPYSRDSVQVLDFQEKVEQFAVGSHGRSSLLQECLGTGIWVRTSGDGKIGR